MQTLPPNQLIDKGLVLNWELDKYQLTLKEPGGVSNIYAHKYGQTWIVNAALQVLYNIPQEDWKQRWEGYLTEAELTSNFKTIGLEYVDVRK